MQRNAEGFDFLCAFASLRQTFELPPKSMNIDRYLNRINVPLRHLSLSYLAELQRGHMQQVPFENLSVMRKEPIVLDEELLCAKIVDRGRGGFCYELNGAFGWLLRELGFDVTRAAAGVYHAGRQEFGPTFDHMILLVRIHGERYLVDVGFGDSARAPVPLPDGHVEDVSGRYGLVPVEGEEAGTYVLQKEDAESGWLPQYRFTDRPRHMADYADRCAFLATSPDSSFTRGVVCTIAMPDGRISLSDNTLTITRRGRKEQRPIADPAAFDAYLLHYFGPQFA